MADNSSMMIVVVLAVVLVASGMLVVPGINAPADAEFGLNTTGVPVNSTDIDDTQSSLTVGTGYIDSEGNLITPSETVAQSVFWAGTTDIVTDVAINPVLTVEHSDAVIELTSVSYRVSFPKIEGRLEGGDMSFWTYTNGITVHTGVLPADGGSLGSVTVLGDILAMDTSTGDELEAFLWNAIDLMNLQVSAVYVDEGTFLVYIAMYVQIENITINYERSGLDGGELTGQYVSPASFLTAIALELEFVVGAPEVTTISWLSISSIPSKEEELFAGDNLITFTFRPRTTGTPSTYTFYAGGVHYTTESWDGSDVVITLTYNLDPTIQLHTFKLVVETVDGTTSYKTITFFYRVGATGTDPETEPETDVTGLDVTFSTYMPSTGAGGVNIFLVGAGVFILVIGGYLYKNKGTKNFRVRGLRGLRR